MQRKSTLLAIAVLFARFLVASVAVGQAAESTPSLLTAEPATPPLVHERAPLTDDVLAVAQSNNQLRWTSTGRWWPGPIPVRTCWSRR